MLFATLDIRRDDYDYALARKMIGIWRRAADLILYGDYYPHTPFHRMRKHGSPGSLTARKQADGLVQGIRFPAAPEETFTIHLKGIQPRCKLLSSRTLKRAKQGTSQETSLIHDGFTFALPARSGAIWFYRKSDHPISTQAIPNSI